MKENYVQSNCFDVANTISSLLKTTLGPRSMLKMILDNQGRVIITNDGNCILREIDLKNPIAKSLTLVISTPSIVRTASRPSLTSGIVIDSL